jgi:stage II sporulation protein AB (anti-sigma F factor)
MQDKNSMRLEFSSRSRNESFARAVISAFAAQADPTLEEINDVKTAVSEAVTNAIVHGYGNGDGVVTLEAALEGDALEITVSDDGRGIADVEQAMQPLFTSQPDAERSGMGFTVMETFMDRLRVESAPGQGTRVRMTKYIGRSAAGKRNQDDA